MSVIVVRSNILLSCSADGYCSILHQYESVQDALAVIEATRPSGVLVVGVVQPDPVEWASRIRSLGRPGVFLPVAIIGSADEFPVLPNPNRLVCPEISSRLRNLLRDDTLPSPLSRTIAVDQPARELTFNGTRKSFSPLEFRLLMFLLRYPGVVFSREELGRRISRHGQSGYRRLIDVLVKRIRSKIEMVGDVRHHLRTVRGIGYSFEYSGDVFIDRLNHQSLAYWPPHPSPPVTNLS